MNSMKTLMLLIIATLLLSSCSERKMQSVDFEKSYKMYFIDVFHQKEKFSRCDFIKSNQNFYIDQKDFLEIFENRLIQDKSKFINSDCIYSITVIQDSEIKFGAFLNVEDGKLKTTESYNFDMEQLITHKAKFKKLEAFEINCYSLSNTSKLINEMEKEGGYIFGVTGENKNDWFSYKGKMKLLVEPSLIETNLPDSLMMKRFEEKFSQLDKIKVISYLKWSKGDSITIELLCNRDFSSNIPQGFEILEHYTDSINLPFTVYYLPESLIKKIADKSKVYNIAIKDLNK